MSLRPASLNNSPISEKGLYYSTYRICGWMACETVPIDRPTGARVAEDRGFWFHCSR